MKNLKLDNVLVIGATGGIGLAMTDLIQTRYPIANIIGTTRSIPINHEGIPLIELDVTNTSDWENLNLKLTDLNIKFDLIISCIGILEHDNYLPEKSLRTVDFDKITKIFQVNTISALMLGKFCFKFLNSKTPSVVVFLSAMVGSIGENEIGGWHSYRASKTALNMIVKNMAIELARNRKPTKLLSIHPGTTESNLSSKYLKGVKHKVWDTAGTANNILEIILNNDSFESGDFVNWDGRSIAW
jgi:NAD(P)-dependent dehydrogenase (short-subunit alcohol dehydrogenase family)